MEHGSLRSSLQITPLAEALSRRPWSPSVFLPHPSFCPWTPLYRILVENSVWSAGHYLKFIIKVPIICYSNDYEGSIVDSLISWEKYFVPCCATVPSSPASQHSLPHLQIKVLPSPPSPKLHTTCLPHHREALPTTPPGHSTPWTPSH